MSSEKKKTEEQSNVCDLLDMEDLKNKIVIEEGLKDV